jgi:hypothetical protein
LDLYSLIGVILIYLYEEKEVEVLKENRRKRAHTKEDQWFSVSEDVESGIGSDEEYPPRCMESNIRKKIIKPEEGRPRAERGMQRGTFDTGFIVRGFIAQ